MAASSSTLDALLGALSVEIEAFAVCEIGDDVRLIIPPVDMIEVHHILEGTLHLTIDGNETVEAGPGSMLIVPPGRLQHLATSSDAARDKATFDVCVPARDGLLVVDATEGKAPTLRVACGAVTPDRTGSYGPLASLTRPVVENLADFPVVRAAFAALLEEVSSPTEGTQALTSALMKACLVVLLRRHVETSRIAGTAPALFHDARIGRAIAAILDHPAADHCVTGLAKEAGMSRSAFAREFKVALDLTPMEFVARVRLNLAHRLLVSTGISVEGIAAAVGFSSRSHFSRLFREHYGIDPSGLRRSSKEKT
ncbi:putative AraC family transcriptional regulator [uncultured Sphingopyxis sp.]|uniref:Putative AraC family transcriptional regulator n=1 Tax=uncultured Sphingopyxis sp. TaxID=310581 RepID=A0A1Y5PQU0_9SPHN|nr:AraC family transcriptional regulator [uncultured Sphingopyxis sp.]SBV32330.1 putative AraC family transcriptional regulator [uncultured Sphingopyxis sp.]